MGIWGNTTLIRLRLKTDEPLYQRLEQMERLIQSGAFLIHMVLGYLGERRIQAKRVRLNQLMMEIKAEIPGATDGSDPWNFEARLKWASRVQRPRMIASSTAQVLEVLFQGIKSFCRDIASEKAGEKCIQKKMEAINTLVARGLEMTQQLRLYSGDFKPHLSRIRMVPLVQHLLTQLGDQNSQIKVNLEASNRLPVVCADRHQIERAVRQIIFNAVQARPMDGTLNIAVRTLQEEPPEERCGVHTGSDYVVITVKDSGPGIAPDIQKRIFEPFFAYPQKHGHLGLGLASADGILKAHNGYIQLQSMPGAGSAFKIYLPIAGAAAQQQDLKHPKRMPSLV
ncbi:MAG: ATP-binding protein [Desulfatitalea sp.]